MGVGVGVGVGRERALRDFRVLKQLSRALEPLLADCPQLYGMAFHEGEREEREEREEEEELDEFLHREGGIVGGAEGEGWEEACGLLRKELRALERLACRAQQKSLLPGRLGRVPAGACEVDLLRELWLASGSPAASGGGQRDDPVEELEGRYRLFLAHRPSAVVEGVAEGLGRGRVREEGPRLLDARVLEGGRRERLEGLNGLLREEYAAMQLLLLRRLDVTVQAFLWSDKGRAHSAAIRLAASLAKPLLERPLHHGPLEVQEARQRLLWHPVRSKSTRVRPSSSPSSSSAPVLGPLIDRGGRVQSGRRAVSSLTAPRSRPAAAAAPLSSLPRPERASTPKKNQRNKRGRVQGNWHSKSVQR